MKTHCIYIVTDAPIPIGFAPTNRILSYAIGFQKLGVFCKILIIKKTEKKDQILNQLTSDCFSGIEFQYLARTTIISDSFLKRRIDNFVSFFNLLKYAIFNFNKKTPVIYYSSLLIPLLIIKVVSIFNKFKLFKEESEHPSVYYSKYRIFSPFVLKYLHYSLFDGLLLMTSNLIDYFNKEISFIEKLHVPMTVNLDRFTLKKVEQEKFTITYCGSLNNNKDGIDILLKAYKIFFVEYPNSILLLIGQAESVSYQLWCNDFVVENGLTNNIVFVGKTPSTRIPSLLINSDVLVLSRPASIQAEHGFPTKLGEYLATGNPVVVTNVGDISKYLIDMDSAFIAEPDNYISVYEKLKFIICNPECANRIGLKGKDIAIQNFNSTVQAGRIISFIEKTF